MAGRLRERFSFSSADPELVEFRDGVHGLVVWAIATLSIGHRWQDSGASNRQPPRTGFFGLAAPDAERRVDTAIASAKANIAQARRSTVILAFMAGAAALVGAAAAWFAAGLGGKHRDDRAPSLRWGVFGPRVLPPR